MVGTRPGLDRFDGINVKSFLQFSGRTIFSIAETDSVYLWVVQIKDYGDLIGKQTK